MKFFVLGTRGMAGHVIALFIREMGDDVIGYARESLEEINTYIGDAHDTERIRKIIGAEKPDVVVNCMGILNKAVDKDLTEGIYVNSYFPHLLAEICKNNAFFIHISTDCVFSGNAKQYDETSVPDATSYYGRTKYLGEIKDNTNLTIRTSIIGPELKENGIGLFHWFMSEKESVCGYRNVIWSGVTTVELAKAICAAAKQRIKGLLHLSNNMPISKYDLLCFLNARFRNNRLNIMTSDTPINSKVLISTRSDFDYVIPPYIDMINDMAAWMDMREDLYRQYKSYNYFR